LTAFCVCPHYVHTPFMVALAAPASPFSGNYSNPLFRHPGAHAFAYS